MEEQEIQCPNCNEEDGLHNVGNNYECNDCGFVWTVKKRLHEVVQEILELSYGAAQFDKLELQSQMEEIHELTIEVLHLLGMTAQVNLIGLKPTTASAVACSIKGGKQWRLNVLSVVRFRH